MQPTYMGIQIRSSSRLNLPTLDGVRIIGKTALEITIELAIEAGEVGK